MIESHRRDRIEAADKISHPCDQGKSAIVPPLAGLSLKKIIFSDRKFRSHIAPKISPAFPAVTGRERAHGVEPIPIRAIRMEKLLDLGKNPFIHIGSERTDIDEPARGIARSVGINPPPFRPCFAPGAVNAKTHISFRFDPAMARSMDQSPENISRQTRMRCSDPCRVIGKSIVALGKINHAIHPRLRERLCDPLEIAALPHPHMGRGVEIKMPDQIHRSVWKQEGTASRKGWKGWKGFNPVIAL